MIIAIDGPAASGKGTLGKKLAKHYGLKYLDTGSLYRAVAQKILAVNGNPADPLIAQEKAHELDADEITPELLRAEEIGMAASEVSAIPEVREILLNFQRTFASAKEGAILDGRDIGTIVCPNADIKLYLTATPEARAKRRYNELIKFGKSPDFDSILNDINSRDQQDSTRTAAPLKKADDAISIETSNHGIEEIFEIALEIVEKSMSNK